MKKLLIVILLIVAVVLIARSTKKTSAPVEVPTTTQTSAIVGCYVAGTDKDVFTMHIASQEGQAVAGDLKFNNFEKDSSSGTFTGTYTNDTLIGDYTFNSEGTTSVMQVAFKKSGQDFVRGYTDVNADGTQFTDVSTLTYDASSPLNVFKKGECAL